MPTPKKIPIQHPARRRRHTDHLTEMRLRRGAEHLHHAGPRAVAEFLAEIAGMIGGLPAITGLLAEYERRLSPAMIRATGADRFPPRLTAVPR